MMGGRGRQGGKALGPAGYCVCPNCGTKVLHKLGMPCFDVVCPKCGKKMTR